ncbi:ABC transporter substrate-binding protein [Gilliamella sp. B2865]|nr:MULTISPECIES: ABC transporter substrate-binding protein [Gilliamella]MCX8583836.1 ABC transporter substrate-binding protein [Gilliamella sp. B3372]MCX8585351.1 ABC transporter substrate-binding protein [Gilliamella sp. B3562]MCX8594503.1 ABC transporter substrate-binding protein [Gilliamella sp. B3367]MCX8661997.1 ABC transporter substrate-binding protein [Gilliamella sp. B2911]MCX8670695.1 ABC transporter substrate-binding protein [Gilliamella sp. B2785]
MQKKILTLLMLMGIAVGSASVANAKGRLVIYCSGTNALCEEEAKAFGEKYNVKTSLIRNGSGSTLAKIEAEKENPQSDIWYGGTLDPHSQAGEMGLLYAYQSPNLEQIIPEFRDPAKIKGNYSSAVYIGILGFGVNTNRAKQLGVEVPKCWADLIKPEFRGEIQIADPQSSGTAYTALATFTQLWGEDKAFDYLKALNRNISQYTKSGVAPARNAARGETMIGIGFLHDYSLEKENGAPLDLISPCEGTGYEIGGISIIKGARNLDNAKLFVDWVLSKQAQEIAWQKAKSYQIPTNITAESSPLALKLNDLNLIKYDFDKYGDSKMRTYLINKWVNDVKMEK